MDFGIVTAKVDEIGYITHAENLGYSHCWVTDSPMIRSNCWAVLALAAQQTRRMRLGTAVNVPGLRLAPAAANGIATINRLAPGRCIIGLGTGHTGHADARAEAHAPGTVQGIRPRRAGAARWRRGGLHARRRDPPGSLPDARASVHRSRPQDPGLRRRLRPEGPGPRGRAGRRPHLRPPPRRHPPRHAGQCPTRRRESRAQSPRGLPHGRDGDVGHAGAGRGRRLRTHRRPVRRRRDHGPALPGRAPPRNGRRSPGVRAPDLDRLHEVAERNAARAPPPTPACEPLQLRRPRRSEVPDRQTSSRPAAWWASPPI